MSGIEMVVVNGVRYRPEHAPKVKSREADAEPVEVEHKMRAPRKAAPKSKK